MKKIRILSFAALGLLLMASCSSGSDKATTAGEQTVRKLEAQAVTLENSYPATVKGIQDVEIRPMVSGFITKLCVSEGQTVKAGELLFEIDKTTYEAAERQAKAAVEAAKATYNTAKLTYDNSVKLYEGGVIGDYELASSKNSMESAAASLAQAEANHISAKKNLQYCYVTSPAEGVVGDLPYKVGALVSSSITEPLTTVSKTTTMQIYFSLTEKTLLEMSRTEGGVHAAISEYPAVKLLLADGTYYEHEGKIAAVSGVIDSSTGSVSLRADFPNPDNILKSGGSGSVVIPYTVDEAIVIPQEAVTQVQDRYFVYVVGEDNKVRYTAITVNSKNDGVNYIVESGLTAGETIVVKGISSLTDGMEITPITEEQYEANLKKAAEMGQDQADLGKLKEDLTK